MRSRKVPGPSLPRSLLEELSGEDAVSSSSRPGRRAAGANPRLSRKQTRRAEREHKKQRKANFYSQSHGHVYVSTQQYNAADKRHAEERHIDEPVQKRLKTSHAEPVATAYRTKADKGSDEVKSRTGKRVAFSEPESAEEKFPSKGQPVTKLKLKEKHKEKTALQKLIERGSSSSNLVRPSVKGRSQAEKEEDAYIAHLERKLGWTKGGTKTGRYGSGLDEDGLDDLLEDIDKLEASVFGIGGSDKTGAKEEDEDSVEGMGSNEEENGDEEYEDVEEHLESLSSEDSADEELSVNDGEDGDEDDGEVEEWTGFGTEAAVLEDVEKDESVKDLEGLVENPAAATRYVPPHIQDRAQIQESEVQTKLTRQLKGLLNRMSEQNISTILDSTDELYRKHRRHDVTSTLTSLIINGISSHSMLLESYVILHAAFVSALHKRVGIEFAAYFVQNVVSSYEKYFVQLQELESTPILNEAELPEPTQRQEEKETRGKECSNLIVLLSELYNFQVIACVLVYDIVRGLLEGELSEVKVELLLKIARTSGQQLRTDDPSSLKEIIQIVHSKLPAQPNAISSRTRFMVETLTNLKNNKMKDANIVAGDAVERMKKFLSGLGKKQQVRSHEPLRVTVADLHSAESKGKWWLVGAAWAGDPLVEHQDEARQSETAKKTESAEHALLKLARQQGMNTDIRRSIFIVLMSSEDYVDACERLSQLKLTEVQQREVIRVILHCCGNEKVYNPYYTFVGQQLCRTSHSHKITLQFGLWDFLRDLGETSVGGVEVLKNLNDDSSPSFEVGKISSTRLRNVARAYAWWIAKDSCTLAILKPVDFTTLKPQTRQFFIELFTHLLLNTQLSTPLLTSNPRDYPSTRNRGSVEEVFIKATRIQALIVGLVYFLGESFRKDTEQADESGFLLWAVKVATDTLRTGADIVVGL